MSRLIDLNMSLVLLGKPQLRTIMEVESSDSHIEFSEVLDVLKQKMDEFSPLIPPQKLNSLNGDFFKRLHKCLSALDLKSFLRPSAQKIVLLFALSPTVESQFNPLRKPEDFNSTYHGW